MRRLLLSHFSFRTLLEFVEGTRFSFDDDDDDDAGIKQRGAAVSNQPGISRQDSERLRLELNGVFNVLSGFSNKNWLMLSIKHSLLLLRQFVALCIPFGQIQDLSEPLGGVCLLGCLLSSKPIMCPLAAPLSPSLPFVRDSQL